ncbi:FAD-binding domain-containing protein [Paraphoma chrysanthemicola]|uniref:FAD-binding domain-containing protein n=1 Tax=Paraphoma chrysanthemicola TaxID=798071 RepID=A0A8K0R0M7_9PLEO|nr:FAD-binding domain-containing protein [Paraphoma chrysanthemicola]
MAQQQYLTDKEIKDFIDDLDHDNNGWIDYSEVERMLDEVHKEIAPKPQPHHLHHASRGNEARHEFLRSVIGTREDRIKRENFEECVKKWQIPSLEQDRKEAKYEDDYLKQMTIWRRIRAFWAVKGPEIAFLALVVSFMIAFGVWQFVKYLTTARYTAAFGWGAVLSKTCAGVLYPTFFFLILSMSRWLSTFLRRFYFISRFVNWDLSQSFHIKMSITALVFATLHAIGHLSGSFVFGSSASRQDAVAVIVGQEAVPRYYIDYVRSLPGWTGLTAIGCFYLLTAMSMPQIRKWSYEVFQLGHLLMFPIIGLMIAHGTAGLLQWPMFGYWLAFPTLLVIFERSWRFVLGFRPIEADLEFLDDETTAITAEVPKTRFWDYKAGQYVFVQVPQISRFQWHPFTVSTCIHNRMQVHIKADGDWTNKLRDLAKKGEKTKIKIGLDGPFGAPAQRFYDFEYSMVFGAGIGVTPFSGVLTDLQHHELERTMSGEHSPESSDGTGEEKSSPYEDHRRVDFHWMVRDKNNLMWFSDLLNEVSRAQELDSSHLDIRIQTYVTQKRRNISQHVFRWLLEKHRTDDHPFSPITGLVNPTHFGRPDIKMILEEHYSDMCKVLGERTSIKEKIRPDGRRSSRVRRNSTVDNEVRVGVFFCGPPVIGQQLADQCEQMTAKARNEGRKIEYRFMIEVFG